MEHYDIENPKNFILAGKAFFTCENSKTKNHLTFKVTQCKDNENLFFVAVCYDYMKYSYIGNLYATKDKNSFNFVKSKKLNDPTILSLQVFNYVIDNYLNAEKYHPDLKFYHHGCCCRCGRTLTTPESIKAGIGPFCVGLTNIPD
jgi:hypothetical protein